MDAPPPYNFDTSVTKVEMFNDTLFFVAPTIEFFPLIDAYIKVISTLDSLIICSAKLRSSFALSRDTSSIYTL